ncbi:MAG: hypothetical protein AB8B72_02655 [Crocinitomicaceae bacterium]
MNTVGQNRVIQVLLYLLPLFIIGVMIFLARSPIFEQNANQLAPAITLDLVLTLPLVYFLIIRKKSIPKTTIVPVLIVGVVTASFIIPNEHQGLLDSFKFWVLPFVELFVITYVFLTIRKSVKSFKKHNTGQFDFHHNLKIALGDILPARAIPFAAMEISAFYYGFIKWKKNELLENEFTYHKETGTKAILLVLLLLILVETFALHLLLIDWSPVFAWILTGLSIYSGFQIIGILKSLIHRPISVNNSKIELKYGLLANVDISFENIETIAHDKREVDKDSDIVSLSPLGTLEGHNIRIVLKSPIIIEGFYGMNKEAKEIALFIDNSEKFIELISSKISE